MIAHYRKTLEALIKKAEEQGSFEELANLVDTRKESNSSLLDKELHAGF